MGTGTERERERSWSRANERKMETGTGAETGTTRVVDAVYEAGEKLLVEREINVDTKMLFQ